MTPQTATEERVDRTRAAGPGRGEVPRFRAALGALLLALAVLAALAAGGWGLVSSLTSEAPPARFGEDVAVTGGLFRVDGVTPEHMAPMQSSKFSAGGMNMSSTGMDMAPEGFERFAVQITLVGRGGLEYAPEDFRLSGKGVEDHEPVRSQLGADAVPDGSAVSGNLVFQAPEGTKNLALQFGDSRPVALNLPANRDGGHRH